MAEISMQRPHALEPDEVRPTIERLAKKLSDRLGGQWCWEDDTAVCELKGARARVGYDADSVSIEVELPRMMRPLKRRLENEIDQYFDRYFGEAGRGQA